MSMTSIFKPRVALLLLGLALVACAHQEPIKAPPRFIAPPPPPPPPPPPEAKLVVFPLEVFALPDAAIRLNEKLAVIKLANSSAPVLATISMETAQLQSECSEPTDDCYNKIAKQVGADCIVWAEAERVGKKKKKAPTKLRLMLFDARKVSLGGRLEESYTGTISDENLDALIEKFTGLIGPSPLAPPAAPPSGGAARRAQ